MSLFDRQIIPVPLDDGNRSELILWPQWLSIQQADNLLDQSIGTIPWRKDSIQMFGKLIPVPRLQNWFADHTNTSYTYSGITMQAVLFPGWMANLAESIQKETGFLFNRALVNYYRDGNDSVDWHADDELELGPDPIISSLSLGAERVFQLRHNKTGEILSLNLPHGSLLLMGSGVQHYYQHRLAKVKTLDSPRVNFTFRYMDNQKELGQI
ncbi:MAG: alpha-ketoglutarate-dependent dioxygenase AlkB family protein [Porticoccaceae bacterium]